MIGQKISHYEILEKLGEGGMGVVYKAQDTKLDRIVALKFLPSEVASSDEEIARFEQEAKAISALNHPNIATIHDVDESNGKKFLVLEYISAGTLKSKIKQYKLEGKEFPIAEVIANGIQIAEGLGHAHWHQIVHRDIKSDNIMLTDEGKIKITDFGLAKLKGNAQITKTGSTIGTLAYMSPEQLRGEEVDSRSDLFSFGVVLFELATLQLPFHGEHVAALTYSIANEEPTPIQTLRKDISEHLARVIHRCLEKDRTKRYQTAEEIVADLNSVQQEISGSVRIIEKQSKLPWAIAAAIVLLAAGLYYFLPSSHSAITNGKTIAVLPFTNMSGNPEDEYFSDGMMEDVLTQLSKIADLNVISRTTMDQYKGTKKTLKEIGKELNAGVVLEGSVRRSGDQIRIVAQLIDANQDKHIWAETYDREFKQVFAIQSEIAQKIAASLRATLSPVEIKLIEKKPTENLEAYAMYLQAREHSDKSYRDLLQEIEFDKKAIQLDTNFAAAYSDLASVLALLYVREPRKSLLDSAVMFANKALFLDSDLAEAHAARGMIHLNSGETDNAIEQYEAAIRLNPNYYTPLVNLAASYAGQGNYAKAIQFSKKSLLLNPIGGRAFTYLSTAYISIGDLNKAKEIARKGLNVASYSPVFFRTLAEVAVEMGNSKEALFYADTLLALDPDDNLNYSVAGGIHLFCGDPKGARRYFEKIVARDSMSFSLFIPANNTTYLGFILHKEGDEKTAKSLFTYSAKRSVQDLKDAPKDPSIPYDLAALSAINGNKQEAYKWMQQVVDNGFIDSRLLQIDPLFENLHGDDKFLQIITQLKTKSEEIRRQVHEMEKEEK